MLGSLQTQAQLEELSLSIPHSSKLELLFTLGTQMPEQIPALMSCKAGVCCFGTELFKHSGCPGSSVPNWQPPLSFPILDWGLLWCWRASSLPPWKLDIRTSSLVFLCILDLRVEWNLSHSSTMLWGTPGTWKYSRTGINLCSTQCQDWEEG